MLVERISDSTLTSLANPSEVEWHNLGSDVPYQETVDKMERVAAEIHAGTAPEQVWLVEHPPLYTAGTSAQEADLLTPERFPVHTTGRGGQYTYHGPGQRVAYVMLDLTTRVRDVRAFVGGLEHWIISTLADFNVKGERRNDRVGVWVRRPELGANREDKIAAIGIRLKRWVSFHGIAINVEPDLEHFSGIVPCGVQEHGVTSLVDLGLPVTMDDLDVVLKQNFDRLFRTDG